jgi:hypothetical protein
MRTTLTLDNPAAGLTLPIGHMAAASFDAWAAISVKLLRRSIAERAAVLCEAKVDDTWRDFDAHWSGVLLEDLRAGRSERVDRYVQLCAEELGRRANEPQGVSSPLDRVPALGSRPRRPITLRLPTMRVPPEPEQTGTARDAAEEESPPSYTPPYPRKAPGDAEPAGKR